MWLKRTMRYFRIPTRCKWDLRSFGTLRNVEWQFRTDVSGQPICPIFKGQSVKDCLIDWMIDFTQRRMEIPYRRFGTTYLSNIQGSSSQRLLDWLIDWLASSKGHPLAYKLFICAASLWFRLCLICLHCQQQVLSKKKTLSLGLLYLY